MGKPSPKSEVDRFLRLEGHFHAINEIDPTGWDDAIEAAADGDEAYARELRGLLTREATSADEVEALVGRAAQLVATDGGDDEGVDAQSLIGQLVGPYRVLDLIGQGGMGAVFRAEREGGDFDQTVAIKVIRRGVGSSEVRTRFRRERRILSRLEHPNIARLLDGGETDDGRPYFVMEYVEGERIDEYCDRHRLSVPDRLALFSTACGAAAYAQRRLIVHRDLKPSNILVTRDGELKLLDFGIAKVLDPSDTSTMDLAVTLTGQRVLTPAYASPEQVLNDPVTTAADVYALGVVLFELLTGRRPYRPVDETVRSLEQEILDAEVAKPSVETGLDDDAKERADARRTTVVGLKRQLSGDLDTICKVALRKEPERRYASAQELKLDIDRHLRREPVLAQGDSARYRTRKFVARHRGAVIGSALGLLAVIVLSVGYTIQLRSERDHARQETRKATETLAFITDLFENAAPERSLGETVTVRELLDRGAERIADGLSTEPEVRAAMMDALGRSYHGLGLVDEATQLLREAYDTRRSLLDDDSRDVASTGAALGDVLRDTGSYAEAESLLRAAVDVQTREFGATSAEVATTQATLATMLVDVGRFNEAKELILGLIPRWKGLGDDQAYAAAVSQLAQLHTELGDHVSQIPLFEEALAIQERVFPNGHPELATTLFNFASVRRQRGEFAEAEALTRRCLDLDRKLFGPDHANVAYSLTSLALALREQGKIAEAEAAIREALRIRQAVYGDVHANVAAALGLLGRNLHDQRRLVEAEAFMRESLANTIDSLGPTHPSVATRLNDLGWILRDRGNLKEALILHERALALNQDLRGESFGTAISVIQLSHDYVQVGDLARADSLARQALQLAEASFPATHPFVSACAMQVGRVELASGDVDSAYAHMMAAMKSAQTSSPWRFHTMRRAVARAQRARGEYDAARLGLTDGLQFLESSVGPASVEAAITRADWGGVELDAGNLDLASDLLDAAWAVLEDGLAGPHPARRRVVVDRDRLRILQGR